MLNYKSRPLFVLLLLVFITSILPFNSFGQGGSPSPVTIKDNSNWNIIYEIFCLQRLLKAFEYNDFQKEVTTYNVDVPLFEKEAKGVHFYTRGHLLAPDFWTRVFREDESVADQSPAVELLMTLKDNGSDFCLANWATNDHTLNITAELFEGGDLGCLTKEKLVSIQEKVRKAKLKTNYNDDDAAVKDLKGYYDELFKQLKAEINCKGGEQPQVSSEEVKEEDGPLTQNVAETENANEKEVVEENSIPKSNDDKLPFSDLANSTTTVICKSHKGDDVSINYPTLIKSKTGVVTVINGSTSPNTLFYWEQTQRNSSGNTFKPQDALYVANNDGAKFWEVIQFNIYQHTPAKAGKKIKLLGTKSFSELGLFNSENRLSPTQPLEVSLNDQTNQIRSCPTHAPVKIIPDVSYAYCTKNNGDKVYVYGYNNVNSPVTNCGNNLVQGQVLDAFYNHDYLSNVYWKEKGTTYGPFFHNQKKYPFKETTVFTVAEGVGDIQSCQTNIEHTLHVTECPTQTDDSGKDSFVGATKNAKTCTNTLNGEVFILDPGDDIVLCNPDVDKSNQNHMLQAILLKGKSQNDISDSPLLSWKLEGENGKINNLENISNGTSVKLIELGTITVSYIDDKFKCSATKQVKNIIYSNILSEFHDEDYRKLYFDKSVVTIEPEGIYQEDKYWRFYFAKLSSDKSKANYVDTSIVFKSGDWKYGTQILKKAEFIVKVGEEVCITDSEDDFSEDDLFALAGENDLQKFHSLLIKYESKIKAGINNRVIIDYGQSIDGYIKKGENGKWLKNMSYEDKLQILKYAVKFSSGGHRYFKTSTVDREIPPSTLTVFKSFKDNEIQRLFDDLSAGSNEECLLFKLFRAFAPAEEYISILSQGLMKEFVTHLLTYSFKHPEAGSKVKNLNSVFNKANATDIMIASARGIVNLSVGSNAGYKYVSTGDCDNVKVTLVKGNSRNSQISIVSETHEYHPLNDWICIIPDPKLVNENSFFYRPVFVPAFVLIALNEHQDIEDIKWLIDVSASVAINAASLVSGASAIRAGYMAGKTLYGGIQLVGGMIDVVSTTASIAVNPLFGIRTELKKLEVADTTIAFIEQTASYMQLASMGVDVTLILFKRIPIASKYLEGKNLEKVTQIETRKFFEDMRKAAKGIETGLENIISYKVVSEVIEIDSKLALKVSNSIPEGGTLLSNVSEEVVSKAKLYGVEINLPSNSKVSYYNTTDGIVAVIPGLCFAKGTPVKTNFKQTKVIEDISEGDTVLSYEHQTKKTVPSIVTRLFKSTRDTLVKVIVAGATFFATPDHPFYANGNYVAASELQTGDELFDINGNYHRVETIEVKDTTAEVFNFEVAYQHNYFIGEKGFLVHNTCKLNEIGAFFEKSGNLSDFQNFANKLNAIESGTASSRGALTTKIHALGETDAIKFVSDFSSDASSIKKLHDVPALVDCWKRFGDSPLRTNIKYLDAAIDFPSTWKIETKGSVTKIIKSDGRELAVLSDDIVKSKGGSKGSWNDLLNMPPMKNHKYLVDDYLYETDEIGRVKRVKGSLEDIERGRNEYQQGVSVELKDGVKGVDDGGHLIANILFGPGEQINYVPQIVNLNRGRWKAMEDAWFKARQRGEKVEVEILILYEGTSKRPYKFIVRENVGGKQQVLDFLNN